MKALTLAAVVVFSGAAAAQQAQVYKPGPGITSPEVVREAKPAYTAEAMRNRIQGEVQVEAIVGIDGKPTDIKVIKSLDAVHGLDDKAVEAVSKWVFKPGKREGKPVPVQVQIALTFTLRDGPIFDAGSPGVTAPVLIADKKPSYTRETMDRKIEGVVELEGVVKVDGTVGDIRVLKSLDPVLDAKAVEAFGAYTYKPGMRGGRAVNHRVKAAIIFSLKN